MTTPMPFGRYKAQPLESVPTDYLQWALANCTAMRRENRELLADELKARGEHPPEKRSVEIFCPGTGIVQRHTHEHTWGSEGGKAVWLRLVKWRETMVKVFVPEDEDTELRHVLQFVVDEGFKMLVELLNVSGSIEEAS